MGLNDGVVDGCVGNGVPVRLIITLIDGVNVGDGHVEGLLCTFKI